MKKPYLFVLLTLFIYSAASPAYGSASGSDSLRLQLLEGKLIAAAQTDSAFYREVDLSIGKISLPEMLRNIAKVSGVNLTVKGAENIMVSVNFSRAKVVDLLYYLCKEYDLETDVVGNIVSIYPRRLPPPPPREIRVSYDSLENRLGFDLLADNLHEVVKEIMKLSRHNLIVPQALYRQHVSGYVEQMPFDQAIEVLAGVNGLVADKNRHGIWMISADPGSVDGSPGTGRGMLARQSRFWDDELSIDSLSGLITARLARAKVHDVIVDLCERQRLNYFFLSQIGHETGVFVRDIDFGTLLNVLLAGTTSSYYIDNGIYIFGDAGQGSSCMTSVQIVHMTSRSVNKVE